MAEKKNQSDTGIETADKDNLLDRGGRRRLADRRQFSSSDHFPERRNLRLRRSDIDRRRLQNQTVRKKLERRKIFKEKYSDSWFRRKFSHSPIAADNFTDFRGDFCSFDDFLKGGIPVLFRRIVKKSDPAFQIRFAVVQ